MSKSPHMSTLKCPDSRLQLRAELAAARAPGRGRGRGSFGWGGMRGCPTVQRLRRRMSVRASLTRRTDRAVDYKGDVQVRPWRREQELHPLEPLLAPTRRAEPMRQSLWRILSGFGALVYITAPAMCKTCSRCDILDANPLAC